MVHNLLKTFVTLISLLPLLSNAGTNINWKEHNSSLTEEIKIGHGAWLNSQNENILISSGMTNIDENLRVENLLNEVNISFELLILTGDDYKIAQLGAKGGNRSFAASVSYNNATIIIGGIAKNKASDLVNLLVWNASTEKLLSYPLPPLPQSALSPSAVIIDKTLYVLAGSDADNSFYSLDLTSLTDVDDVFALTDTDTLASNALHINSDNAWTVLASLPQASATSLYQNGIKLAVQNDGAGQKIFAVGGYLLSQENANFSPINNLWKFNPKATGTNNVWQVQADITIDKEVINEQINSVSTYGQSHIFAFTAQGNALSFNAITNSWTQYNQQSATDNKIASNAKFISQNVINTDQGIYSLNLSTNDVNKELQLWQANIENTKEDFGWVNMTVLVVYLLCVVLVGLFFVFKNKNTDDYFRGGQSIPWWAAACSIYATMLSSLTYVALPAIVYQTDWLYLIGIWMMIVVAPIAIYVAMPFFRQIDATSAYEYLSKRFNMGVRLFASGLFTLFHIGRMGIVMALTALALSAVTPLSASDSVLIMGVLCLVYCTMGGIEAVIWTDTIQTIVLLVGAVTCFVTIILGLDGGLSEFITVGFSDNKFTMVNNDFSLDSITTLSIWVIVLGGIGQNLSSYTADQAVVQRYMVTSDPKEAAKSIWANAAMAIPGILLFFCIGTGLYVFYQAFPERLDPNIQIDQIFPTFIAAELPLGIAGLIVAGIFAAAQSTVSTSMNSTATTLVTDFIKPFDFIKTEKGYMSAARWLTFIMGALGTLVGLIFIDPEIRSLMNAYFKIIGMFMGALGGLFVLGALTKRANSTGAIIGLLAGVGTMISAWLMGWANGYLYAAIGIIVCLVVGYLASFLVPESNKANKDLTGLTLYTMRTASNEV
jgi:SSS family transporter